MAFKCEPKEMAKFDFLKYRAFCDSTIEEMDKVIGYHAYIASRETGILFEDIKQEMALKMFNRLWLFDPVRTKLSTFCYVICLSKRRVIIRKHVRRMKKFRNLEDPLYIYDKIYYDNGDALEMSTVIEDKSIHFTEHIENDIIFNKVHKQLRGEASEIFSLVRQGVYHKDIATILGKSRQTVANIIRRKIKPIAQDVVYKD